MKSTGPFILGLWIVFGSLKHQQEIIKRRRMKAWRSLHQDPPSRAVSGWVECPLKDSTSQSCPRLADRSFPSPFPSLVSQCGCSGHCSVSLSPGYGTVPVVPIYLAHTFLRPCSLRVLCVPQTQDPDGFNENNLQDPRPIPIEFPTVMCKNKTCTHTNVIHDKSRKHHMKITEMP